LICRPMAAQWDPNVPGLCGNQIASFVALEVLGMVLDLTLMLVPSYFLANLHLNRRKKAGMIALFNTGAL
jgi:hypothetical protein